MLPIPAARQRGGPRRRRKLGKGLKISRVAAQPPGGALVEGPDPGQAREKVLPVPQGL